MKTHMGESVVQQHERRENSHKMKSSALRDNSHAVSATRRAIGIPYVLLASKLTFAEQHISAGILSSYGVNRGVAAVYFTPREKKKKKAKHTHGHLGRCMATVYVKYEGYFHNSLSTVCLLQQLVRDENVSHCAMGDEVFLFVFELL